MYTTATRLTFMSTALTLLWSAPAAAQLPATNPAEDQPRQIARAIAELGDPSVEVRERGTRKLSQLGPAALPALRQAMSIDDPEIAARAGELLHDFVFGIHPDTPPDQANLVRAYRRGSPDEKRQVLAQIAALDRRGVSLLARVWSAETDPQRKDEVLAQLRAQPAAAASAFLAEGDFDSAERMIQSWQAEGNEDSLRAWAACLVLRGKADEKIAELRRNVERAAQPVENAAAHPDARPLSYLYRAKGDLAGAKWAAQRSGDAALLEGVRLENRDFNELAAAIDPALAADNIERLSFLAAYHRLSGDDAAFEQAINQVQRYNSLTGEAPWYAAEAMLLNDRPRQAIDHLLRRRQHAQAFELLHAQHRYTEALAALEHVPQGAAESLRLRPLAARALKQMGQRDKAVEMLDAVASDLRRATSPAQWEPLIETEALLAMDERALQHAAQAIDHASRLPPAPVVPGGPNPAPARANQHLFGIFDKLLRGRGSRGERGEGAQRGLEAMVWYEFFKSRHPDDKTLDTLRRVRDLLEREPAPADLPALAQEAVDHAMEKAPPPQPQLQPGVRPGLPRRAVRARPPDAVTREDALRSIGKTLIDANLTDAGLAVWRSLAETTQSPDDWQRLADHTYQRGDWPAAADLYAQTIEKDRMRAAPRYLRGLALLKSGREGEGKALMAHAELMPLAADQERYEFARALLAAGAREHAGRQFEIVSRTAEFQSWFLGDSVRFLGHHLYERGEYLAAAAAWERAMLDVLRTSISYLEPSTYLAMPVLIHRTRARGLAASGKIAQALREVDTCFEYSPADISVAIEVVPELDKRGHKKEADALFTRAVQIQEKLLAEHPDSAAQHNSLAWLLARTRRQIDRAIEHATKGVELEPANRAIIDTLSEAYFQKGDKPKAIELINKCIKMEPHIDRHRTALKRFEESGPETDPPPG